MAGTNKLNDKRLRALSSVERSSPAMFADGAGLSIKASKLGQLSWVFTYRLGGREARLERLTLGKYPDVSLKAAREKRDKCREWLAEGFDPRSEIELKSQETLRPVTVKEALEYWLTEYAEYRRSDMEMTRAQLRKHIYAQIGHLPLAKCETRHWIKCFDSISRKMPVTAGRMFQICKQALRFCSVRRYATSDALVLLTLQDVGKPGGKRDRILSNQELSDVWLTTFSNDQQPYYRDLLKILVVFGARTVEARQSTWKEWDFIDWVWTVPKENSKRGSKIVRPIPEAMRPWLIELKKRNEKSGLLLGEEKSRAAVSLKGRRLFKEFNHSEAWSLHDLRRNFSTGMNDIGIAPHIVEMLLGHVLLGVMAVYNRSQYLPEKLDALNKWIERLDMLAGNHDNVILLTSNRKA